MDLITSNFKNFSLGIVDPISRGKSLDSKLDVPLKEL